MGNWYRSIVSSSSYNMNYFIGLIKHFRQWFFNRSNSLWVAMATYNTIENNEFLHFPCVLPRLARWIMNLRICLLNFVFYLVNDYPHGRMFSFEQLCLNLLPYYHILTFRLNTKFKRSWASWATELSSTWSPYNNAISYTTRSVIELLLEDSDSHQYSRNTDE